MAFKSLTSEEEMGKVLSVLVGEKFSFNLLKNSELEDQLTYYFTNYGVTNEDFLSTMIDANAWPKSSKVEDTDNSLPHISETWAKLCSLSLCDSFNYHVIYLL